ncbi:Proteasome subunit alpha type-2 [Triticum urartu]|uniref:Proteasome subunit alpha type-2 n=3 Tax=Pooideae TaxID=147368 RepID=M7YVT8_TRIUA|nr:Proteasome subunit alpha type-2 [Triticum urartu]
MPPEGLAVKAAEADSHAPGSVNPPPHLSSISRPPVTHRLQTSKGRVGHGTRRLLEFHEPLAGVRQGGWYLRTVPMIVLVVREWERWQFFSEKFRFSILFPSAAALFVPSDLLPQQPEDADEVAMGDSQYSFSLTTFRCNEYLTFPLISFSPSGKLVQIEHALTAVGSGQTSLGIKAANGVVIATEKKLPSILVDETSVQKIQSLTPNIGVVYSGMGPDFRVLVRKSRKQAQQYYRLYKETIPVTQLVRETAAVMQEFTQSGGVRPFGVSLLIAGYDDNGPQLYQVDPSGSYFSWKASAMGKNVSNAKTFLEKRYTEDMELDDAIHTAILTLKEGYEGQISANNIEIGVIRADREFKVLTPAEIKDFLEEVE